MGENNMNSKQLGWIGTGIMGGAMAFHLINAGHQLYIYNRSRQKADALITLGAKWCDTPQEVARCSEVVFCMVGFPQDVKNVILDEKHGLLYGMQKDAVIVDMTTSSPQLAQQIYTKAESLDIHSLDAPVSGGDVGAKQGTLSIMIGGEQAIFDRVLPLLQCFGSTISLMGPAGAGQHTKMCNQILIASTMIGVVESLLYAFKSGMNLESVIDVIGKGAASSWSINNLGRKISQNDYAPGFFIKHFVKDMGIALAEARRMNLSLPGLALAHQFYVAAMAKGYENLGTQGLYQVLSSMNGVQ
jgi:3-hydroxyisobutyrate dehydrogenase